MIELEEYSIYGMKSLESVEHIPVLKPTIITGGNDGGKSSSLLALAFLLGEYTLLAEDFTTAGVEPGDAVEEAKEIAVEGTFLLDDLDMAKLGLPERICLRRTGHSDSSPTRLKLKKDAPVDVDLRDLEGKKLADLKALADSAGVVVSGPRSRRDSFLTPLLTHVDGLPHEKAWITPPAELESRLPKFLYFSSTDEPDPEGQIRTALSTAYRDLLDDESLIEPIRTAERTVQTKLTAKAKELCDHVVERCPELSAITVEPEITFTEGFRNVNVSTGLPGGSQVPLNQSGAGRRRRINLAIWEWTGDLVASRDDDAPAVVIAYDEPDTHLDYAHQRSLVDLIRKQGSQPGVRTMVATHSLNLIDRVDIKNVVHLKLDNHRTFIELLGDDDHIGIDKYLAGVSEAMGLRNSVLLHEKAFVGVEGPTEMQVLPILFRLATGLSLQSAGIALISGNGNDGALRVVEFLKGHGRHVSFVLVDADSSDGGLFREPKLKAAGVDGDEIFYIGEREFEDLFSDELWAETANTHWPRNDGEPWETSDFAALRGQQKFSKEIADLVGPSSDNASKNKPGYLVALVQDLTDADQVPPTLAKVFADLLATTE